MAQPIRIKDELANLKTDADKVIQDISKISARIRSVGMDKVDETTEEVQNTLREQLAGLQSRLNEMSQAMSVYRSRVDGQIKQNPYAFIAGALGTGFLLGKLFQIRSRYAE